VDVEADLVIALRSVGNVRGEPSTFTIKQDRVAFEVVYSGGSSSSLTLSASYDAVAHAKGGAGGHETHYRASARGTTLSGIRPMSIKLRSEDNSDRAAKAEGINREHQTGDARFDEDVYIDSPTTSQALLDAVLAPPVRAAAMELLSLAFDAITIDDAHGNVEARLTSFGKLRDVNDAAPRIARAFATLLSSLPIVTRTAGAHEKRSALPMVAAAVGALVTFTLLPIAYIAIASGFDCTEGASDGDGVSIKATCSGVGAPALLAGAVAGTVVAMAIGPMLRRTLSGHSDSQTRIRTRQAAAFVWTAIAAFLLVTYFGFSMVTRTK
jgi:hypothetical protein